MTAAPPSTATTTDISLFFSLPEEAQVFLGIYNLKGQQVATLMDGQHMERGIHNTVRMGQDDHGRFDGIGDLPLPAGRWRQAPSRQAGPGTVARGLELLGQA